MSKTTMHQRHMRTKQPYTRVQAKTTASVQATPQGPVALAVRVYEVYGYTFEGRLSDPEKGLWTYVEEEHELGQAATLQIAQEAATEWRNDLVGIYPIP